MSGLSRRLDRLETGGDALFVLASVPDVPRGEIERLAMEQARAEAWPRPVSVLLSLQDWPRDRASGTLVFATPTKRREGGGWVKVLHQGFGFTEGWLGMRDAAERQATEQKEQ